MFSVNAVNPDDEYTCNSCKSHLKFAPLSRGVDPFDNVDIFRCLSCKINNCCPKLKPCVDNCICLSSTRDEMLDRIKQCEEHRDDTYIHYLQQMIDYTQ